MPIYLVRHGEARSKADDPDRSLTESGKATVHGGDCDENKGLEKVS